MSINRASFTIFELLIVVVIISTIYTLFIQNIGRVDRESPKIELKNLPKYVEHLEPKERASIICLRSYDDRCIDCALYIDGAKQKVEFSFFEGDSTLPTLYSISDEGRLEKMDLGKMAISDREFRDICFQYDKRYNNSLSEFVLEYDDGVLIFYPYFRDSAKEVITLNVAEDELLDTIRKLDEV